MNSFGWTVCVCVNTTSIQGFQHSEYKNKTDLVTSMVSERMCKKVAPKCTSDANTNALFSGRPALLFTPNFVLRCFHLCDHRTNVYTILIYTGDLEKDKNLNALKRFLSTLIAAWLFSALAVPTQIKLVHDLLDNYDRKGRRFMAMVVFLLFQIFMFNRILRGWSENDNL